MGSRTLARSRKTIFDPVHGVIALAGAPLELINHPAFQRLWGIRQTGFAHLVFPGANHTRLEHSLGAFWVAHQMAEHLDLDAESYRTVTAGALLHDLGHGPFSHTFDSAMEEVLGYGHETISRQWIVDDGPPGSDWRSDSPRRTIPRILERFRIDPERVANLIDPAPRRRKDPLLRAMLHGAIDVDRIDYLQRDAHYTGVAHGAIDAVRLLDTAQPYRGRLAFAEKGQNAVEGFLVGRALMYASVYYHKTVRSAEVMAEAALEMIPGYPDSARPLFDGTDGELLHLLERAGAAPRRLVRAIRYRQLHKRVAGYRKVPKSRRAAWRRIAADPEARRALERELARRLNGPDGGVLVDLAGLDGREASGGDWDEIAIVADRRVTHPFRSSSLWGALALRPPAHWELGVYVDPRIRVTAAARLPRLLASLP